jgi:hypothetical protein
VNDDLDAAYSILRAVYLVNRYRDLAASAENTDGAEVVAHARALIDRR